MSGSGGAAGAQRGSDGSGTVLPPIRRVLSKPPSESGRKSPSESGRSGASKHTARTGGTKGGKARSRKPSSRGSASDIASQVRSLTRKTLSDGGSESMLSDGSHGKEERKRVRDLVTAVYLKVLGRTPDPAGLNHYSSCVLDGEIKTRGLIEQLCRTMEFEAAQDAALAAVSMTKREWVNRFHPWNAEPDEADEEVGTVRWVYNDVKANSQRWETGENEGGSLGAEVVDGTLFNSTKDHWTSVVVEHPVQAPGVHVWRIKKIFAGASGSRGRVGVLVRDCEMDMDYQGPHFSNRAFFLDEDGNVWNGNAFVGYGTAWAQRNSVVTLRLDTMKRVLSFYVTRVDSSHWAELLATGQALPGPLVARITNIPDVPLYAFAQDLYAGSGFSLSKFETQEPDEAGQAEIKKILARKQTIMEEMGAKEVDMDERKRMRKLSMAGTSVGTGSRSGSSVGGSSMQGSFRSGSVAGSFGGKSFKSAASKMKSVSSFVTRVHK